MSDEGEVRSWARRGEPLEVTAQRPERAWRPVKPWPNTHGYLMVGWYWQGKRRASLVHRLVLLAFHGEPPPGHEARHVNGVLTDNRAANLQWGTTAENHADMRRHGTCPWRLDAGKAREIRARRATGESYGKLAKAFGVSRCSIIAVIKGRTYKEVET